MNILIVDDEALARTLRDIDDEVLVITMTAYPEVRTAVAALKAGAYDYINKPFDLEDLASLIGRGIETRALRREVAWRRAQSDVCELDGLLGDSPAFRELMRVTQRIAAAPHVPVLIHGESGSGKERVARAIHCQSPRGDGPWVETDPVMLERMIANLVSNALRYTPPGGRVLVHCHMGVSRSATLLWVKAAGLNRMKSVPSSSAPWMRSISACSALD